jgi:hypothetical protein
MENTSQAMKMIAIMAATLRDTKEMHEGPAYAALMGHMSLNTFQDIVLLLKKMGICKSDGYVLRYVEPVAGSPAAKFMDALKACGL